jgi:hypothetical protein
MLIAMLDLEACLVRKSARVAPEPERLDQNFVPDIMFPR